MERKTKNWILALAVVFILSCIGAAALRLLPSKGSYAAITVDGKVIERVDLNAVTEAYDIEIHTEWGSNTVTVSPGGIAVSKADCPDQICVRQGTLSQAGMSIICMPHRLVVTIEGGSLDG